MDKEEMRKALDDVISEGMLQELYRLTYPFQPYQLQWMNIEDGKLVKEKIDILERVLNDEDISQEEWDKVLDPERFAPGVVW